MIELSCAYLGNCFVATPHLWLCSTKYTYPKRCLGLNDSFWLLRRARDLAGSIGTTKNLTRVSQRLFKDLCAVVYLCILTSLSLGSRVLCFVAASTYEPGSRCGLSCSTRGFGHSSARRQWLNVVPIAPLLWEDLARFERQARRQVYREGSVKTKTALLELFIHNPRF